jgi:hypothetical protein
LVNIGETETQYDFEHPDLNKAWPTCVIVYERKANASQGL